METAERFLAKDARITAQLAERIVAQLRRQVSSATSADELAAGLEQTTQASSKIQFIVAHALINLAEEAGKYRGGNPTLADQILDQQSRKVRQYGDKAYRLSEKQVEIIARDAWQWLRPEMRQGV